MAKDIKNVELPDMPAINPAPKPLADKNGRKLSGLARNISDAYRDMATALRTGDMSGVADAERLISDYQSIFNTVSARAAGVVTGEGLAQATEM